MTKEQVRESKDEEIVADILAFMLLEPKPSSRSEYLDDYFGFGEGEASNQRFDEIELAVQKNTVEIIAADFQRVLDQIKETLNRSGQTFGQLLFGTQPPKAPRYFQTVFLALYKLIVKEHKEVANQDQLVELFKGSGQSISIPEGGRWGAKSRENTVNGLVGIFSPAFQPAQTYDPAQIRWITQLENILTQSYTEQAAYDFKQGLLRLDGQNELDESSFEKILKTLVAISNLRKGVKGYVIVGIADREADARRVQSLFGVTPRPFEKFYITGVEHEAKLLNKDLDQLFQFITERVKRSNISEQLRDYVARNIKLIRYYEKSILIFESQAQFDPSNFSGIYYVRYGSELKEVPPQDYGFLFRRFQSEL